MTHVTAGGGVVDHYDGGFGRGVVDPQDRLVERTVELIESRLSEGWTDWDVSAADLHAINRALQALTPAQTNEVIAQLDEPTLARWTGEINGVMGGLSAADRQDLFAHLATDLEGMQLARLFGAMSEAQQAEFVAAINARSHPTARLDFVDATQRAALTRHADIPPGLSAQQRELLLDLGQLSLDIIGLADPTPITDGANALISLVRGDFLGAGLSAVSMFPYLGDAAKLGKLGKWAETVANAVEFAGRNAEFARAAEPILRQIAGAVDAIPDRVLRNLPEAARGSLDRLRAGIDEFLTAATRAADGPLVLNANLGRTTQVRGQTVTIGEAPSVSTRADGRPVVAGVDGQEHLVRRPQTYDNVTTQPDGTLVYSKNGQSVTYDADGFPVFDARAEVYLEPRHINSGASPDHMQAANEALRDALRGDPVLKDRLGLTDGQYEFLMRDTASKKSPPGLTWHHHQDTGRMQLVDRAQHSLFPGGHVGGMAIWGGGR